MKITKIAHGSILIEAEGIRILSDPWWRGPCFGAQWWLYPPAFQAPLEAGRIDYIYISHGHHDHFHPGTLLLFPKDTPILVSAEINMVQAIQDLGFPVITVGKDEEKILAGNLRCRIMRTHGTDTLMTLTDGKEVCVNLNDALHSAPSDVQDAFIAKIKAVHPVMDYVYCGYGIASHFPNCYFMPGKDPLATTRKRQGHFTAQWVKIIHGLNPKFGFPFAADVVLLESELFWANEAVHNCESPASAFKRIHPDSGVNAIDGDSGFSIDGGRIVADRIRGPLFGAELQKAMALEIVQANRIRPVSEASMEELTDLVRKNLRLCAPYLAEFAGNYAMLIKVKEAGSAIEIRKRSSVLQADLRPLQGLDEGRFDLVYQSRLAYIKNSLTSEFGNEVLFVGSGGIFTYPRRRGLERRLNEELTSILRRHLAAPASRKPNIPPIIVAIKSLARRILRVKRPDLYSLTEWTVFRT